VSDFDLENIRSILGGHGDWYGAILLRTIAEASDIDRGLFYISYPKETQAIFNLDLPPQDRGCAEYNLSFDKTLRELYRKADPANKRRLERSFSRFSR
tara:strand:+ start:129 stop:422 length:294 start_codon:yes stop_codon:yes gene_type:complete